MAKDDDLLGPSRPRRRRKLPPALVGLIGLAGLSGLAALWVWVFTPVFTTPQEFHEHQKRFDRAIRTVLRAQGPGGSDPSLPAWPPPLNDDRIRVLACAEGEVAMGVRYLSSQQPVPFPWGDVPAQLGTSADIVVRCLRAVNADVQQMMYVDRKAEPKRYPVELFNNKKPDRGVDHRRVSFLFAFLHHFLPQAPVEIETPEELIQWLPGDFVFWAESGRAGHPGLAGIVTDRRDETGMPLVVTLVPSDTRASSHRRLDAWPIIGHASLVVDDLNERFLETYPGTALEGRPPESAPPDP